MFLTSCKGICIHPEFKAKFKVLKQLGGKIKRALRKFYRYCPRCTIFIMAGHRLIGSSYGGKFIISKVKEKCPCCQRFLRKCKKIFSYTQWRINNRDKYLAYQWAYYQKRKFAA